MSHINFIQDGRGGLLTTLSDYTKPIPTVRRNAGETSDSSNEESDENSSQVSSAQESSEESSGETVSSDKSLSASSKSRNQKKKIGDGVYIDRSKYELIDFYNPLKAAAELAMLYYGKKIMASHSVSGGQAPGKRTGDRKPKLPSIPLSIILNYVFSKYEELRGSRPKILNKEGERIPLTIQLLRQAVMKKCYSCAAY
jgi:hypothetical protein